MDSLRGGGCIAPSHVEWCGDGPGSETRTQSPASTTHNALRELVYVGGAGALAQNHTPDRQPTGRHVFRFKNPEEAWKQRVRATVKSNLHPSITTGDLEAESVSPSTTNTNAPPILPSHPPIKRTSIGRSQSARQPSRGSVSIQRWTISLIKT